MAITEKISAKNQLNPRVFTWENMTWVDIVQPNRENVKYLVDHYNFNPLDIDDALSTRQVAKIEEYPDYLFVVFYFSVYDKNTRVSSRKQWSAFIGENFLVTLRPPEFKAPDQIYRECEMNEEAKARNCGQGSGYLLYQIIDRAVDSYFRVLDKLLSLMEAVEDNVFKERVEVATELGILRRDINTQRRVMFPTRPLLLELEKKLKRFSQKDLTPFFSDLMDHMNKICETLDEYTENIEVFKDADYTISGNRANRTIRTLAVLFALALPFLMITGIYILLPGSAAKGSLQLFITLVILIFVIFGLILYILRRRQII